MTPTLGRLLQTMDWKKLRAAYWTPMTANHYRLVGSGKRDNAAELIWSEYSKNYQDASNREWGEVLRFLLVSFPGTMLWHLPRQLKNRVTKGKFVWNPLV